LWLGIALANDSQVSSWSAQMPYIEKALEIEPLSIEAATNMVSFLTWFPQRREEAWAIIDSLNQHYPDHPDVKWTEASLLLNESRPSDAVPLLEEIIANDPNNGTAGILLSMAWFTLGETERAMRASTWGPQYRLVLSPNPEESLGQMKISSDDMGPAISAYIFVMLRDWQSAIDVLAEHSDDIVAFEKKYAAVVAKRYSPAMSLAFAYKSLGDIERSSVFIEFEKEALNIKSENGKIRNSEYLTVKARLNALDGKHYEAMQELERLITLGPVDLRILMHPAFDEIRELPQFIQLQELQRGLVNAEREKLGLLPLPAGVSHQLVQKTAE
jgi:tetratricopeptide (TPR) repeat protein